MSELPDLPAATLLRRLREGHLRPVELTEALLDRVARREGIVRAFATLDEAGWRSAAAAARTDSPLAGLPVGVKDVLDTAALPSGYGSPIWEGHRPRADAASVARMQAAGGIIAGKTVTTEFATRHPGPTTNPHDSARTPGGSSQGSAAGVAAGFFPLAFGTQTAGSVIRPAAYCGITGFKPSYGLIHRAGMKVMSETLDTIGTMARDVAGCAMLAGACAGLDWMAALGQRSAAPRIALIPAHDESLLSPETMSLLDRAARVLAAAGARVTRPAIPEAMAAAVPAHQVVMQGETRHALAWELATAPERISDVLRERMEWAGSLPEQALPEARGTLATARRAYSDFMAEYDLVLTASAQDEAPLGLESTGQAVCNLLWTSLHAPCVTLPAGKGPNGMPLGVQLVGRIGADAALLAHAEWAEAALH
jgi:amidase